MVAHSAVSQVERQVAKSKGEGSRGGHIVGHTRSGKPIYGAARSETQKQKPVSDDLSSKRKAAAFKIAGGLALTIAGGYLAGSATRKAALAENIGQKIKAAVTQPDFFEVAPAAKSFAIRSHLTSHFFDRVAKGLRYGGRAAGAALIGKGASESLAGTKYDTPENRTKVGIGAASTSAILSTTGFYRNILGNQSLSGSLKRAAEEHLTKKATTTAVKKVLKKEV